MSETNATLEAPQITPETPETPAQVPVEAPKPQAITIQADGKTIIIRSAITTMLEMLGYGDCHTWSPAKVNNKVSQLPTLADASKVANEAEKKDYDAFMTTVNNLPAESKAVFDCIMTVAAAGSELDIVADSKMTPKKTKAPKAPKTPKEPKAPKEKKVGVTAASGAERDNFGCQKGTRGYEAMALLKDDSPMKIKDIVKATGREGEFIGVFYNFLNDQVKKGNVSKSEAGYQLTPQGLEIRNRPKPAPVQPAPVQPETPAATPPA